MLHTCCRVPEAAILNRREIFYLMERGVIEHAKPELVNPASLNVELDYQFLLETRNRLGETLSFKDRQSPAFECFAGKVIIPPGGFCLSSIKQKLNLPLDLACDVMLRSSAARMGIQHLLAGWGDPGYSGFLTLELKNDLQHHAILLQAGDAIVQLRFIRVGMLDDGEGYTGKYTGDTGPQVVKPEI